MTRVATPLGQRTQLKVPEDARFTDSKRDCIAAINRRDAVKRASQPRVGRQCERTLRISSHGTNLGTGQLGSLGEELHNRAHHGGVGPCEGADRDRLACIWMKLFCQHA